jgi:hypothetical protein
MTQKLLQVLISLRERLPLYVGWLSPGVLEQTQVLRSSAHGSTGLLLQNVLFPSSELLHGEFASLIRGLYVMLSHRCSLTVLPERLWERLLTDSSTLPIVLPLSLIRTIRAAFHNHTNSFVGTVALMKQALARYFVDQGEAVIDLILVRVYPSFSKLTDLLHRYFSDWLAKC